MRVQDIMEKNFPALQADDSLDRILEIFHSKRIKSAPVFAKGDFLGVLSCSDLLQFFTQREGMGLHFLEGAPSDASKATASSAVHNPPFVLTPDQPVRLVLGKITFSQDCIPVMSGKKVVGVVWPEGVLDFFLAERAKGDALAKKKKPGEKKSPGLDNSTAIDSMLEIVKREGTTTPKKVANELGITESTAEDLAKLLGKHNLVEINYSFLTGMVMRRIGHG